MKSAVLVVFVVANEVAAPVTSSFSDAAREVLGPDAVVRIEPNPWQGVPPQRIQDERALARAGDSQGVLELSWQQDHDRAQLRVYIAKQHRWIDRSISFDPSDDPTERGRMVGFAVASMLLDLPGVEREPGARTLWPRSARAVEAAPLAHAIGLTAVASHGIGGYGGGIGPAADLRLALSSALWLRFSGSATFGEVPPAQATVQVVSGSLGLAWQPFDATRSLGWGGGVRLDASGIWLQVSHLSEDDPEAVRERRWLSALDAMLEGSRALSSTIEVTAAAGSGLSLGRTFIYTHGQEVAALPLLKVLLELGVRARF